MEIKQVGVVGCGLMGHGIAQVTAQSGYDVIVREVDEGPLDKGLGRIEAQLARAVEKGKLEQAAADEARGRIEGTLDYADLADCDLVIEAVTEGLDTKLEMWREVDGIVKDDALFATNTSSLPVINQAAATGRPGRFLGLHFFNPVQVMKLLEVIRCVTTTDETLAAGLEFGKSLGKLTVATSDKAGFIVNRLLVPYMLDAIRAYEEGVGTIDQIDEAMKAGAGHPMGPLRSPTSSASTRSARSATCSSTSSASAASRARRRCARCWPPAGTGASRAAASTTTRARRPWRSSCAECFGPGERIAPAG